VHCNVSVHMTVFPPSSSQPADTDSRYVYTEPYVKIRTCNKVNNMGDIFYSRQARWSVCTSTSSSLAST